MGWVSQTDEDGHRWLINPLGLLSVVRRNLHADLVLKHTTDDYRIRWIMPNTYNVKVNFGAVTREKNRQAPIYYNDMLRTCKWSGAEALKQIVSLCDATDSNTERFNQKMHLASRMTMDSINSAVETGEIGAHVSEVVRDLSASVLVAGATLLSGGAALAVLGAGSSLKGVATYQTTGNVGSAILTATGSFVVGAIPIGASFSQANNARTMTTIVEGSGRSLMTSVTQNIRRQGVVILVGTTMNAGFEMSNSLIDGNTMEQSIRTAGRGVTADAMMGLALGPILDRGAFSVPVRLGLELIASYDSSEIANRLIPRGEIPDGTTIQTQFNARVLIEHRQLVDAVTPRTPNQQFVYDNVLRRAQS